MCGFATFSCCGCNCVGIYLNTASNGEGGLQHWLPTSELSVDQVSNLPSIDSDIELVSKHDVFCKGPITPFYVGFDINDLTYTGIGDAVIRIMARVETVDVDGFPVIGDHCFCEIRQHPDLDGVISDNGQPALWIRIGVCIDGVDTILNSGTAISTVEVFDNSLELKFGSGLASSTGQIKFRYGSDIPLTYIAGLTNFREGDYFLAEANITLTGDTSDLAAKKGKLYRLDNAADAGNPASWIEAPPSELDDPYLFAGSGEPSAGTTLSIGTSIYQSDADAAFGSLPGRKVAIRVTNMSPSQHFEPAQLTINNAISTKSIACPFTAPSWQDAPVKRITPLPVYTGSITGSVTGLIYPGWSTKVGASYPTVYPDMLYLGSGPAESITPPLSTQGIIRQTSFCKYGPIADGTIYGTPNWLYARITAEIKITWSQTTERRFTYTVAADVSYRVDNSETSWTLAQLLAGDYDDMTFTYRADTAHGGHAETGPITVESHLAPDISVTLDPDPTGPAETNRDRLDVFELTIAST
ncbi:hypothetical protein Poly21_31510 [Allorhodopirellula heiligendammensis]|uniref:Uncharacterized protein n=1 Tax=Allorhodopirellula heiligendammensis TaxID=2714739 RepID=A0A5C6BWB6_9BACT|nr:hypothetical protein Poly21_31510 [Allorhodopirellula heiligendammensis]